MPYKKTTSSLPMTGSRRILIKFFHDLFFMFSSDSAPVIPTTTLLKYRSQIAFDGEWGQKGRELVSQLDRLGVKEAELHEVEKKFVFGILTQLTGEAYKTLEKEYKKLAQASPSYPPFRDVFCFISETPIHMRSNVEAKLLHLESRNLIAVDQVLRCFPGCVELGIPYAQLSEEVSKLTQEQRSELLDIGLLAFMKKYPRVIRPESERSVWSEPKTAWSLGKKPMPVYLNITEEMLLHRVHAPVKMCSCGITSSDLRAYLLKSRDANADVLKNGLKITRKPTPEDYKKGLVIFCDCGKQITWSSLSTKYCQKFESDERFLESIFNTFKEKVSRQFPDKDCYICGEGKQYEQQHHHECVNAHQECICLGCESERTTHRNSEARAGSLITRHLHNCNCCYNWHPTDMGQYLKEVPENHQVRRCLECTSLFHQALECGADEIPPMCQPCADKKERERRFVYCPWCDVGCERKEGCDLICCGCDYSGNPILMAGQHVGCGRRFCYGCGVKFHDNLMDWTCSCYIEGTYPKQYRPAETSTCYEDRYGIPYPTQDRQAPPAPPSPIIDEDIQLQSELLVLWRLERYFPRAREHTYAPQAPQRSSRPRMVQDLDMEIDPEILSEFFSTFDE